MGSGLNIGHLRLICQMLRPLLFLCKTFSIVRLILDPQISFLKPLKKKDPLCFPLNFSPIEFLLALNKNGTS